MESVISSTETGVEFGEDYRRNEQRSLPLCICHLHAKNIQIFVELPKVVCEEVAPTSKGIVVATACRVFGIIPFLRPAGPLRFAAMLMYSHPIQRRIEVQYRKQSPMDNVMCGASRRIMLSVY